MLKAGRCPIVVNVCVFMSLVERCLIIISHPPIFIFVAKIIECVLMERIIANMIIILRIIITSVILVAKIFELLYQRTKVC